MISDNVASRIVQRGKIDIGVVHFERVNCLRDSLRSLVILVNTLSDAGLLNKLIVCDDSYRDETILEVENLCIQYGYEYRHTGGKRGLSINNNLLLSESSGETLLHLQDDFVLDSEYLGEFLDDIRNFLVNENLVMLRLFNVNEASSSFEYSDTPHIKKQSFHDQIGRYPEYLPMHKAELLMKQKCKKVYTNNNISFSRVAFFYHIGEELSFNPSNIRDARLRSLGLLGVYKFTSYLIKKCLGL